MREILTKEELAEIVSLLGDSPSTWAPDWDVSSTASPIEVYHWWKDQQATLNEDEGAE